MKKPNTMERLSKIVPKIDLKMKLTFFFLIVALFQIKANSGYSQNTKISIDLTQVTLAEVFSEIESKTEFKFFYKNEEVDLNRILSLKIRKKHINEVLDKIFQSEFLSYEIFDKHIIIKKATALPEFKKKKATILTKAAQLQISGTIEDKNGTPLPGASVVEKGTTNGTQSDFDGNFTITISDDNAVLVISYVGFATQEVPVAGQTNINVTLQEDAAALDEVVVVGYGTQKRVNLTGSVAAVGAEELENRPVSNITNLLSGQVAGLTVVQQNGRPGQSSGNVRIRGIGTLGTNDNQSNLKNAPLIMVDGVEGDLQDVDPNDIENISVLKDASSAAIYGVRAANGVILVTTKRGKTGRPVIRYNGGVATQEPYRIPDRVGAVEYAQLWNQRQINDGNAVRYTDEDIQKFASGSNPLTHTNVDHFKEFLDSGDPLRHFHNFSLSGGTENTRYFASFGYIDEGSLISSFGYQRKNYRLNLTQKITDNFEISALLAGSYAKTDGNSQSAGQLLTEAYRMHPGEISRFPNGLWSSMVIWGGTGRNMLEYVVEPLGRQDQRDTDFVNTITATYDITPELQLRGRFTARNDYRRNNLIRFNRQLYQYNEANDTYNVNLNINGFRREQIKQFSDYTGNFVLNYKKTVAKNNLEGLFGYEQRKFKTVDIGAGRSNVFGGNEILALNGVTDEFDSATGNEVDYSLRSFFSRINYNYGERYFLESNIRYDGTSRFPKANRFAFFPSVSLGWRISNEPFFKSQVFDNIMLKASWGQLGNQEIGNFAFLNIYAIDGNNRSNYAFGDAVYNGVIEGDPLSNTEITWETTTTKNVGVDMALLGNRLTFSAEYYVRDTDDILLGLSQPGILGAKPPVINAGSVKNKGYDLTLGYQDRDHELKYQFNANLSYVENEITDLKGADSPGKSVGDPIQNIFGYVANGLFQSQSEIDAAPDQSALGGDPLPGDVRYMDIDGRGPDGELTGQPDGVVNADDRRSLGTFFPKYSFGLQLGLEWKGLDFSMLWQGFAGHQTVTSGPSVQPFWGNATPTREMLDNFWTPQNTGAEFPRLSAVANGRNHRTSTFWMRDGDFIKLRNLQVGYTLPQGTLGIEKIRIYISGENLFDISAYDQIDPEFAQGNPFAWNDNNFPSNRQYLAGLNITF